jgi:hypothetical protein
MSGVKRLGRPTPSSISASPIQSRAMTGHSTGVSAKQADTSEADLILNIAQNPESLLLEPKPVHSVLSATGGMGQHVLHPLAILPLKVRNWTRTSTHESVDDLAGAVTRQIHRPQSVRHTMSVLTADSSDLLHDTGNKVELVNSERDGLLKVASSSLSPTMSGTWLMEGLLVTSVRMSASRTKTGLIMLLSAKAEKSHGHTSPFPACNATHRTPKPKARW